MAAVVTVLMSSAGRRVELLHLFRQAAIDLGIDLKIVAADMDPGRSAACQFADAAESVPSVSSPSYADALFTLCKKHRVSMVVPLIDPDVAAWSELQERARAELGVSVTVSSPQAVAICRDKALTAEILKAGGLAVPRTWRGIHFDPLERELKWPLICKPADGSSSVGLRVLSGVEQARISPPLATDVVQEKIEGTEVTVNAFYGRDGVLLYSVPHRRLQVRSGEVSKGITIRNSRITDAAETLGRILPGLWGPICFQGFIIPEGFCIFEINARFGGGYPLAHAAGARGPQYLLLDVLGRKSRAIAAHMEGLCMLRYDQSVFVRE